MLISSQQKTHQDRSRRTGAQCHRRRKDTPVSSLKLWYPILLSRYITTIYEPTSHIFSTLKEDNVGSALTSPSCAPPNQTATALLPPRKNKLESRASIPQSVEKEKKLRVRTWAEEEEEQSGDGEQPHGPISAPLSRHMRRGDGAAGSRAWWAWRLPRRRLASLCAADARTRALQRLWRVPPDHKSHSFDGDQPSTWSLHHAAMISPVTCAAAPADWFHRWDQCVSLSQREADKNVLRFRLCSCRHPKPVWYSPNLDMLYL